MPGMTMVFKGNGLAMLDQVKAGDTARFEAGKADGAIVGTVLEARPWAPLSNHWSGTAAPQVTSGHAHLSATDTDQDRTSG